MNRFDSPPAEAISKGKIRSDILNIFKPCLIYMKVFGLVPYTLNMEMTPFSVSITFLLSNGRNTLSCHVHIIINMEMTPFSVSITFLLSNGRSTLSCHVHIIINMEMTPFNLLINLLFSSATFLYIFRHYVLDTRFLSVKSYDLIPVIILYFYSMTLCMYMLINLVQNLRKHAKSKKILHKLVQIDSHLLSLLHIPPSNISLTRYVHTMTATNLVVYICLAASTRILFPYATLQVIGFFVPLINVDVILILLVSKISTLKSRFETLNTVINRVATDNDRNENKTVNSVERNRLGSAGAKLINVMRLGRVIPEKFTEISNADGKSRNDNGIVRADTTVQNEGSQGSVDKANKDVKDVMGNDIKDARPNDRIILETLENVVKIHFDICELCTDVNNRYSYQILATLCIHFLSLCSAIYSCIALGITASKVGLGLVELQKIIYYTSWLVATFFWISLITKTSHDTMAQDTFPDIEQELDLLVRHLEKHTVQFTAHGFFLVDYKIFCMMIGTAATYWMVLVQLEL
ncbi:hypothetical protein M8J77_022567 [Diaphorina citri]|nr:hypothetical protein M8J77_022567 [Diaphorina citri]